MQKPVLTMIMVLLSAVGLFAAGKPENREVNVYSHRHYDSDRALFARFRELTGIQVNVVEAEADKLIERLKAEGAGSPADLLITVDVARLERAREAGLLKAASSPVLNANIPAALRHPQGYWYGLTKRARVIIYNKAKVTPDQIQTYGDLGSSRFAGRLLMRSSTNTYNQSLTASFVAHEGEEKTLAAIKSLVANFARAPQGGDTDQIKAVALGVGDVTVSNTYYYGKLLDSANPEEVKLAQSVGLAFPEQSGRGTHINVSGAGITASSKNTREALALLEFLSGDEAQKAFALANYEYPVKPGVDISPVLKAWGNFKEDTLNLAALGAHNAAAVRIMTQAGWK